jgi:hypothetical protein
LLAQTLVATVDAFFGKIEYLGGPFFAKEACRTSLSASCAQSATARPRSSRAAVCPETPQRWLGHSTFRRGHNELTNISTLLHQGAF